MNILQCLDDPKVFGAHFKSPTWDVWRVFLAALFALQMTPEQLQIYQKFTGRTTPPTSPLHEAWLVCGRRSGKSYILALIAINLIRRLAATIVAAETMEARMIDGEDIDIGTLCQLASTTVRISTRLGLDRRLREIVPDPLQYAREAAE